LNFSLQARQGPFAVGLERSFVIAEDYYFVLLRQSFEKVSEIRKFLLLAGNGKITRVDEDICLREVCNFDTIMHVMSVGQSNDTNLFSYPVGDCTNVLFCAY
jgi:hypothetical protein